jgi:hypothetical protein
VETFCAPFEAMNFRVIDSWIQIQEAHISSATKKRFLCDNTSSTAQVEEPVLRLELSSPVMHLASLAIEHKDYRSGQ